MKVEASEELISRVLGLTGRAGIVLSPAQTCLCARHIVLMLEWNRKVNLTGITDVGEILSKHLLDSLMPAQWLPLTGLAIDIGTGAGFPGVPLKILNPDLDMVLLDASRKKVSFLKMLISDLSIPGINAQHGKWEEMALSDDYRGRFSLIVMRAVRLEETHLTMLAQNLLKVGGVFAWWAGPKAENAMCALGESNRWPSLEYAGGRSYELPESSGGRVLYMWKRRPL